MPSIPTKQLTHNKRPIVHPCFITDVCSVSVTEVCMEHHDIDSALNKPIVPNYQSGKYEPEQFFL